MMYKIFLNSFFLFIILISTNTYAQQDYIYPIVGEAGPICDYSRSYEYVVNKKVTSVNGCYVAFDTENMNMVDWTISPPNAALSITIGGYVEQGSITIQWNPEVLENQSVTISAYGNYKLVGDGCLSGVYQTETEFLTVSGSPEPVITNGGIIGIPEITSTDIKTFTLTASDLQNVTKMNWYLDGEFLGEGRMGDNMNYITHAFTYADDGEHVISVIPVDLCDNIYSSLHFEQNFSVDGENMMNTIYAESYNENNEVISASKSFFDDGGKSLQAQSMVLEDSGEKRFFATQPVLDRYERPVLSPMPILLDNTEFVYTKNLILNSQGNLYTYDDIYDDYESAQTSVGADAIAPGTKGTLGWYYSALNDEEELAPESQYPYALTQYYDDGSGEVKRSGGIGERLRIGSGHEVYSKTFPLLQELEDTNDSDASYLHIRNTYVFPGNPISTMVNKGIKTVSVDANGAEVIAISDEKENVLATATSNRDIHNPDNYLETNLSATINPDNLVMLEFHIPNNNDLNTNKSVTTVSITGSDYTMYDLQSNAHLIPLDPLNKNLPASFYRLTGDGTTLSYTARYYNWSYNFYDDAGRLVVSISPNGLNQLRDGVNYDDIDKTVYHYNYLGWLLEMEETDAGITRYKYRKDGSIRFSQNAVQNLGGGFSYTHYDKSGRPVESGEYVPGPYAFDSPDVEAELEKTYEERNTGIWDGHTKDWLRTYYDLPNPACPRTQEFIAGAVSYTENENMKTWYSYDEQGRVTWMIQQAKGLDNKLFTVDYDYDFFGNVVSVIFQKDEDTERYCHYYEYDKQYRLKEIYTSTDVSNLKQQLQARYYYYLHGPLKRVEYGNNVQGLDYIYTIQGWLKAINHPDDSREPGQDHKAGDHAAFSEDLFAMTLEYFNGDYHRTGVDINSVATSGNEYFNGNIANVTWRTGSVADGATPVMYAYNYDNQYQLTGAIFGVPDFINGTMTASGNKYKVQNLAYDPNGNIRGLQRYDGQQEFLQDFAGKYNYELNTNKLSSITGYAEYTYNDIGQLEREAPNEGEARKMAYDVTGKVISVSDDQGTEKVSFKYDDRGFRLMKKNHETGLETWYIRDAGGNVLTTYEKSGELDLEPTEAMIYGSGRIGMYRYDFLKTQPDMGYITGDEVRYQYEGQDYGLLPGASLTLGGGFTFEAGVDAADFEVASVNMDDVMGVAQYELTDHLGNVRVSVTSEQSTMNFFTNLEQPSEEFQNTDTRVNESPNNHTPGGTWVSRLNPVENTAIGPSISLAVSPGDEIDIEVFARYLEGTDGVTDVVDDVAALLASVFANVGGTSEQINLVESFGNALGGVAGITQNNPDVPKAYLQYIIFDKGMQRLQHGHQVLMPEALNGWQKMHLDVNVQQNGYIYIFVANESMADIGVYFDDMRVQHTESPATSASDYYPFGLTMINRSYTSEPYRFGYQGQFAEYDEETGWNSFELRQYDPVIGRWTTIDPKRQYWSPYLAMGNNPIISIDPDGGKCFDKYFDGETGNLVLDTKVGDNAYIAQYDESGNIIMGAGYIGKISELSNDPRSLDFTKLLIDAYKRFKEENAKFSWYEFIDRNNNFASLVGTGKEFDLKNREGSIYDENTIDGRKLAIWNNRLMRPDDWGNYAFGIEARAHGFSLEWARFGAGMYQLLDSYEVELTNPIPIILQRKEIGGIGTYYDPPRDHHLIGVGYKHSFINYSH